VSDDGGHVLYGQVLEKMKVGRGVEGRCIPMELSLSIREGGEGRAYQIPSVRSGYPWLGDDGHGAWSGGGCW